MLSTLKNHKLIMLCLLTTASATFAGPHTWWNAAKGAFNTAGKTIFSHKAAYALPLGLTTRYIIRDMNYRRCILNELKKIHHDLHNDPFREHARKDILVIQEFIHEELRKQNFPHPEQIQVIPFTEGPGVAYNFFAVDENMREDFIKAGILHSPLKFVFEYNNETGEYEKKEEIWHTMDAEESQRKLNEIKCTIGHEAGHFIANDFHNNAIINRCVPILTSLAGLTLLQKLNSYVPSDYIKGLLIAASVLPLYAINNISLKVYSRFKEARADEHVPNESDYLKGGITYFEESTSKEKEAISKGETPDIYNNKLTYLWHETHPTSESRANRFKKRLEKLDQQKA